ncbi:MAG TPA: hypothetical protein VMU53_15450 [Candidatus Sulfotelmatobacter sp.]|nr:hypothetical protein [Candidatus Sulfotelmatobacter sp.]
MTDNQFVSSQALRDFYGVNLSTLDLRLDLHGSARAGFFHYGPNILCYGKSANGVARDFRRAGRFDALHAAASTNARTRLPVDFSELIENLRRERYVAPLWRGRKGLSRAVPLRRGYYAIREALPQNIRQRVQRAYFKNWKEIPFPNWPVDFTADALHQEFLKVVLKSQGLTKVPFIWFWPEGATACAILTHDVETVEARDFSSKLMDLDEAYGFRASFQVVPEGRYSVPLSYWNEIQSRHFEFNIHGLSHKGYLFRNRREFERLANFINSYVRTYGARGFRARGMYRNLDWFDAFEFSYDMSVPNVAHLEPQRGGCCTVMPFFVGNILEIPLTTSQDHSVFCTLQDYSIELWKKQVAMILKRNGLISFLTHPDYLIDLKPRGVYDSLLTHLRKICDVHNVWHALPGEVDRWWRARSRMKLTQTQAGWKIEGAEAQRARIAYASLEDDHLTYTIQSEPPSNPEIPSPYDLSMGSTFAQEGGLGELPFQAHYRRSRRLP